MVRKGQVIGRVVDIAPSASPEGAAYMAHRRRRLSLGAQADAELGRVRYLHANGVYAQARLGDPGQAPTCSRAQVSAARARRSAVGAVAGQGADGRPLNGRC